MDPDLFFKLSRKSLVQMFKVNYEGVKQISEIYLKFTKIYQNDVNNVVPLYCYLAGIYLFKVDNRNTRARCEICSKLAIKTLERRQ